MDIPLYTCLSLAFLVICLLLIIVLLIQNHVDKKQIMATPSIRKDEAVLTAYASVRINASADEVFGVITSFEKYGSGYSQYKWDDHRGKTPIVGAKGLYSVRRFPTVRKDAQDLLMPF